MRDRAVPNWIYPAFGFAVPLVAALAFVLYWWSLDENDFLPIDRVYVVDDDTLLVAGTNGVPSDQYRSSRLALLDLDGSMHTIVIEKEATEVLGVADSIVWLENRTRGIHARTLPGLELVDGIGEAVRNHGPLSHRAAPQAFTEQQILLLAGDQRRYAVGRDGSIAESDGEGDWSYPKTRRGSEGSEADHEQFQAVDAAATEVAKLTQPSPVVGQRTPGLVVLPDPRSVLVTSRVLTVGGESEALHRMTFDGNLVWSTTAEVLMDAVELERQLIRITWVGVRGDAIHVLLELTEWDEDRGNEAIATHVWRFVEIDPGTGTVTAVFPVQTAA